MRMAAGLATSGRLVFAEPSRLRASVGVLAAPLRRAIAERKPLEMLRKIPDSARAAAAMRSKASATSGRIAFPCQ